MIVVALMFCLDTSGSMSAKSGAETRLEVSVRVLEESVRRLERWAKADPRRRVEVGLCAFSDRAYLIVPPAPLDPAVVIAGARAFSPGGATALGEALELGAGALASVTADRRALIALTDGENNQGIDPRDVLEAIGEKTELEVSVIAFERSRLELAGARVFAAEDARSLETLFRELVEDVLLERVE